MLRTSQILVMRMPLKKAFASNVNVLRKGGKYEVIINQGILSEL